MSQPAMPAERQRQFDVIDIARVRMIQWARENRIKLEHVEYVVPFVETDFRLFPCLFFDTSDRLAQYQKDGTSQRSAKQLLVELSASGYPVEWLEGVSSSFASKEVVDRECGGSYYAFLR